LSYDSRSDQVRTVLSPWLTKKKKKR
jgi:hypothetical protein